MVNPLQSPSGMVEAVAKAIGDQLYGEVDPETTPNTWETSVHLARYAIGAMRELSRDQRLAMQKALLDNYPSVFRGEAYVNGNMMDAIYSAAINAALNPQGEAK